MVGSFDVGNDNYNSLPFLTWRKRMRYGFWYFSFNWGWMLGQGNWRFLALLFSSRSSFVIIFFFCSSFDTKFSVILIFFLLYNWNFTFLDPDFFSPSGWDKVFFQNWSNTVSFLSFLLSFLPFFLPSGEGGGCLNVMSAAICCRPVIWRIWYAFYGWGIEEAAGDCVLPATSRLEICVFPQFRGLCFPLFLTWYFSVQLTQGSVIVLHLLPW